MTALTFCEWPLATPTDQAACTSCDALTGLPDEQREQVERMAAELLWRWTGRRFGTCSVSVRPCRAECAQVGSTFWGSRGGLMPGIGWVPVLFEGQWWNIGCGSCGQACSCAPDEARAIALPGTVAAIESIWVDGMELPTSAYRLTDGVLYRTDGKTWPECNNDFDDPRAPGSAAWEINYQRGTPVPIGGQVAAYRLACELAMAICDSDECGLPDNVRSVTRQGVSMEMVSTEFRDVQSGATGVWLIDSWVASVNAPIPAAPQVFSPDIAPGSGRGTARGLGRGRTW